MSIIFPRFPDCFLTVGTIWEMFRATKPKRTPEDYSSPWFETKKTGFSAYSALRHYHFPLSIIFFKNPLSSEIWLFFFKKMYSLEQYLSNAWKHTGTILSSRHKSASKAEKSPPSVNSQVGSNFGALFSLSSPAFTHHVLFQSSAFSKMIGFQM